MIKYCRLSVLEQRLAAGRVVDLLGKCQNGYAGPDVLAWNPFGEVGLAPSFAGGGVDADVMIEEEGVANLMTTKCWLSARSNVSMKWPKRRR